MTRDKRRGTRDDGGASVVRELFPDAFTRPKACHPLHGVTAGELAAVVDSGVEQAQTFEARVEGWIADVVRGCEPVG